MKWRSKIFILLSALMLCAVQMAAVSAAPDAVIDTGRQGAIRIRKYAADNLENHTVPASGEEQNVEDATPIENIGFTIIKVADNADNPAAAEEIKGEGAYRKTTATDENGEVNFEGLELGVYLVKEEPSAAVEEPVEDFLVSVPMTNAAGNEWLYEVYVYPKNVLVGEPDVDISVTELNNRYSPADLGSEVSWIISAGIPADIAAAKLYDLHSTLNQYLTYVDESVSIYFTDGDGARVDLEEDEDFTLGSANNELQFVTLQDGRTKMADAGTPVLYVEFRTRFYAAEPELPQIITTPVSAGAGLTYTNELGVTYKPEADQNASVYTGGLNLLKVDGSEDTPLAGARFQIYRTWEEAIAGTDPIPAPDGTGAWEATTDESGTAGFYGLSYGVPGDTPEQGATIYYLVEVQAPKGYNLLAAPEEVSVNYASHQEGNGWRIDNYTGFTLPMTGGMGTLMLTAAGLLAIAAAVIIYKITNRREDEE